MRLLLVMAALLGVMMAGPAMAGDKEIAAIEAVFSPAGLDTGLFSEDFLKQVPAAQITAIVAQVSQGIGPIVSVTPKGGPSYLVETATYELPVDIVLDGSGKISGFFLHPPVNKSASLDDLLKQMAAAAPQSAYLVTRNGQAIASSDPDKALAVGSAYKLGILKALKDEIEAGTHKWDEVATLIAADRSLPTGELQDWPSGSPVTLYSLAALMMSISDNTAADALLRIVGRDKVEAAVGIAPVLSTRELFVLKADAALRARYVGADLAGQRQILAEADGMPLPDVAAATTPHADGVEWYLPPSKLCALIDAVSGLDVTQINPGAAQRSDWSKVSFKGGSEVGVLSAASLLTAKDGTVYCVAAIWNGRAALDEGKVIGAYGSVLHRLAGQ
jgi:hypothetical protein